MAEGINHLCLTTLHIKGKKNIVKGINLPFLQKSATWSFQSFHLKEDHAGIITVFILCKSKGKI